MNAPFSHKIAINISARDGSSVNSSRRIERLLKVLADAESIAKNKFGLNFPPGAIVSFHNYKQLLEVTWAHQRVPHWQMQCIAEAWAIHFEHVIEHCFGEKPGS